MKEKQKKRLIEALEIRMKQLEAEMTGQKYTLHSGHHVRDVVTILAILKNGDNIDTLLANMPTERDLPG